MTPYHLTEVPSIHQLITDGVKTVKSTEELHKISKELEGSTQLNPKKKKNTITKSLRWKKREIPEFLKNVKIKNPLMDLLVEKALEKKK